MVLIRLNIEGKQQIITATTFFFILHGPTVPSKWTFLKENSLFMLLKFALNARNLKIVLF